MNLVFYYHQLSVEKKKTEREIVFENIDKDKYNTFDGHHNLLFKTRRYLNLDLIQEHFNYNNLEGMLESLNNTKNTYTNEVKVSLIKSGLGDLENEIKPMSRNEIKSERPDVIVKLVEKILDINNKNQQGQGLKILTPQQMFNRLPTSLAQLEVGNNSENYPKQSINIWLVLFKNGNNIHEH